MNDYLDEKKAFFNKHGEYHVVDHGMEYDRYFKTYAFADGAGWYEECGACSEDVEVEVHGIKVKSTVKLFRVEYWSSESPSKFYYEKY